MSELPKGWESTSLKESLSVKSFISDGDWIESKDQDTNGGVRLIQLADIGDGLFKNKSSRFMTMDAAKRLNCTFLEEGDLLIARMPDPLGRACIFPGVNQKAVTVVDVCLIRNIDSSAFINPLLKYWINSPLVRNLIYSNSSGSTRKRITRKKLESFSLPAPPLAEQKRIVEKLDEVLAQVDSIKARLDSIPDILKRFRQSVLASAVSGKLTEEWRGGESFNPLQVEHNIKLPTISQSFKDHGSINTWVPIRLGSVVDLINGDRGKNYPNKSEYTESGIPFINTGHIDPDGTLSIDRMSYISRDKYLSLGSGKVKPKDIVYCLRGATMGKTAKVDFSEGAIASSLVILRANNNILSEFIYYFLISPVAKKLITEYDNGSAQPNLSAKSLASYPLYLPPLEEQAEIVSLVDQYFAFADAIEKQVKNAQQRVDKLTQSILAKAFRGELVPQDPDDEPADKLLERIAKAKQEADALAKVAKKSAKKTAKSKT
ncbi:restriction endonuclease subunit S [Marinomonas sp. C2222]|uniref:Restriction endonuclease subunit S n=1 Tax=Marinomonas sargassi TaxID=2984494 RepID=A0ABT2YST3_9GAMM|nr:restriction endonuclease subunit S [Marinomonas sargassi]MCV2402937.1 restriction endonuclease subunit S [Marinomonas sargassi]